MKVIEVLTSRQKVPILTYKTDIDVKIGDLVIVPIGNSDVTGIVWRVDIPADVLGFELKSIKYKVPDISLSKEFINFIESFSKYYIIDLASVLRMILPVKLEILQKVRSIKENIELNLPSLTEDQMRAVNEISGSDNPSLLYGVTGSGKTEVYFHLVANALKNGKQILILVPEIGLTKQLIERFKKSFGISPMSWHSGVSPAKKRDIFYAISNGEQKILIGTRSSLFLPFKNLGLIVIDEEHDGSYKQEENILYNARDSAILRALYEKIKVVLVSATPSIETYHNSLIGKYDCSILHSRFGNAALPKVSIIDMKKEPKGRWISKALELAIDKSLKSKTQVILFINRKGYAPLVLCTSCGFRFACKDCASWLVYHKKHKALICHHCGYEEKLPQICPDCSNESLIACGPGVERIEEEVRLLFADAKIEIFTKDQTGKNISNEIIEKMENGEIDILIGTQVLAKGFHFPKVTTVGIIDSDIAGTNIDLKANERCFQMINQVSGRAGREEFEGEVILQTYFPENQIFNYIVNQDSKAFYENEIARRDDSFLPPFSRIAGIIITGDDEILVQKDAKRLRDFFPKIDNIKILGPAPATLSKLKGKYRYRIILIADKKFNIQNYIKIVMKKFKFSKNIDFRTEIDPISFY